MLQFLSHRKELVKLKDSETLELRHAPYLNRQTVKIPLKNIIIFRKQIPVSF